MYIRHWILQVQEMWEQMKTKLLIIIATITISLLGYTQYADAICMENQDWANAPCYGCINCHPGLEQERLDWAPYYDYKGSTWMESKKQQLETTIHNNSLREWFEQDSTGAPKNLHHYYFLQGDVPNIYGMNFDEALGFEIAWNAIKYNSPDAPLLLWNYHDVILDGIIIETDLVVTLEGDHVPLHHIKTNSYFKGEKSSDMISAVENPDDLEFDLFENGLFYLKKLESQNLYTATIASAKTFGNCDARDLIEISPVLPNEKPARSAPILPEGFVDPCVPDYFDVDPDGMILENDRIPEPEQDSPVGKNCGSGTVMEGGICVVDESQKITTDSSGKWDSYQSTASPLKQMQSGIKFHNVECKEGLQLVYKKTSDTSACVTLFTEIELVVRGWATDDRVMLGCPGERVEKCYPDDPTQYRNDLYEYYFGDGKGLPSSDSFDFTSLHTENACTDKPRICYGMSDNGTKTRISCDYPLHGCGIKSFDSYKIEEDIPQWKKYITVSAIRIDDIDITDMLPSYKIETPIYHDMVKKLLAGADRCKNETEVCTISRGISVDRNYPFLPTNIFISENDKFTITVDSVKAEQLLSILDWKISESSHYILTQWNEKQYLLILSTFDNTMTPDVEMRLEGTISEPISLEPGMTLKYPINLKTWATYGAPAQIDLLAVQDAKDSGINVWVEPETLVIPERSNATTTLFIQASEDVQEGIYDIRVIGKANGNNAGLYCSHTACPTVSIGDSDWSIRTFGSNTGMGIGSGKPPENTSLKIELNKKEFFQGETVEIRAYLVNNGTQDIVLDEPMSLLIKAIRADSKGYYDHFYGIDARNESGNSITVEPNSKALLVRSFYWDQMTFDNLDEEHRLEPSPRKMTATFVAGEHTWKDNTGFEIK